MNNCYHLFSALSRGWRAPGPKFVLNELPGGGHRVMPIYDHMKSDPVKHDNLQGRIKGLTKRLRRNPLDAKAMDNLERYQTELGLRRLGKPTPDFHV